MQDEIGGDEQIVRAIPFPKFNAQKKKISAQAFIDRDGLSVSRTAVLKIEELNSIFVRDLHKPPDQPLVATVAITVARMKTAVENPVSNPLSTAVVIADPIGETEPVPNPAHALVFGLSESVRRKFTEGQAKRVLAAADPPVYFSWNGD